MKTITAVFLAASAALLFAACGGASENKPANTANTNTSAPVGPPTVEALKALEVKAFEAYKNKDTKYFETFLDRNFTAYENGKKKDKATVLKEIGGHKDDIKGYTFSDEKLTKVGAATAVLTMKAVTDGTRDGKKVPDVISSTLYVRQGTDWRAAWHGEVAIVDPTAPPAKADEKKANDTKTSDANPANTNTADAKPAANAETDALVAVEKSLWEAWMERDAKKIEGLLANEFSFVNIFGAHFPTRADALKDFTTDNKCDIKSVSVADGTSVSVTGDTSILFHTGRADGTCGGQKITGAIQGTSVYVKDGTAWKVAFTMNRPAM